MTTSPRFIHRKLMKWIFFSCAVIAAGIVASSAAAQTRESARFENWYDAGIRLELPADASLTFTQHLRLTSADPHVGLVAPELELKYDPVKWWRLEAGYRFMYEPDNDGVFQNRHRVFAGMRFRIKFDPVGFSLRVKWQEELRDKSDDGTPTRHMLRSRLEAKLRKVPVVSPFASAELFQRIDGQDDDITPWTVTKLRFALGVEWNMGPVEMSSRYLIDVPLAEEVDPIRHIFGLSGRFDWAPWKEPETQKNAAEESTGI